MMRVKAVEGRLLPWADSNGTVVSGRYVARARVRSEDRSKLTFEPMPEGEDVPETSYYQRALRTGDIAPVIEDIAASPAEIPAVPLAEEAASTSIVETAKETE